MPFEELDKKIREAAEQHHPAYDEKAWAKMEKLLDRHLPQEKRRRRIIFWIFPLLILAGSGVILLQRRYSDTDAPAIPVQVHAKKDTKINHPSSEEPLHKSDENNRYKKTVNRVIAATESSQENFGITESGIRKWRPNSIPFFAGNEKYAKRKTTAREEYNSNAESGELQNVINSGEPVAQKTVPAITEPALSVAQTKAEPANRTDEEDKLPDLIPSQNTPDSVTEATKQKSTGADVLSVAGDGQIISATLPTKQQKKSSSFFIAASLAPDISFVGGDEPGKIKLIGGFGIGYSLHNKWTVRTGFYSGRKVYTASGTSYNPPAAFYQYYPILEKVAADCKVYEIPVMVSYHFRQPGNGGWFVSAGLSTLLMKKETYDYAYKYNATGATYYKSRTITNENNHYFSLMTLSGGYQRSVGKRFFIMAEPYFKLPLSGVGFGKVKLNSSGILFSAGFKLAGQKKK